MTSITMDLVRRRAEHNNGEIYTLEELSLHQMDIERIEHLHNWCPDLKILYLQGNLISKIENVRRFKRLVYLNLALNCIERIENLDGCESLQKLDLTANFVRRPSDLGRLAANVDLRELYLTGNPCVQCPDYRSYAIAVLPQLEELDGQAVLRTERIDAKQRRSTLEALVRRWEENTDTEGYSDHNCPEARRQLHEDIRKARARQSPASKQQAPVKEETPVVANQRILNSNRSQMEYHLEEETDNIRLTVKVAKYVDTSLMDVDVHPRHVRVVIKGHVLQLVLPAPVRADQAVARRSLASGDLVIEMPTVEPNFVLRPVEQSIEEMPALESID